MTQGTQSTAVELNDDDGTVPYSGLPLVQFKRTVVRIYANRAGAGPTENVTVQLWVIAKQGPAYSLNLLPDNGPRDLVRGDNAVTPQMRAGANTAYTYTFNAIRSDTIELYAEILTKQSHCSNEGKCFQLTTLTECGTCGDNNTMRITGIPTKYVDPLTFSPVEVTWTDVAGTVHRPPADPRDVLFRKPASTPGFGDVSPQPAFYIRVQPYVAQLDVTDLKTKFDAGQLTRTELADQVLGRVAGVETADFPGYTIGLSECLFLNQAHPTELVPWFLAAADGSVSRWRRQSIHSRRCRCRLSITRRNCVTPN